MTLLDPLQDGHVSEERIDSYICFGLSKARTGFTYISNNTYMSDSLPGFKEQVHRYCYASWRRKSRAPSPAARRRHSFERELMLGFYLTPKNPRKKEEPGPSQDLTS